MLHRLVDKELSDVVRITDGYRITLKTSDPSKYPFPHPTLLLLHSMISSIVAAQGGADSFDNPYLDRFDDESLTLEELTAEENSEPDASSHWVHHRTSIHTYENLTPPQDVDWPPDILKSLHFEDGSGCFLALWGGIGVCGLGSRRVGVFLVFYLSFPFCWVIYLSHKYEFG